MPGSRLTLIAALDRHRLIGVASERMPWHLPEDLKHFRRTTMGRPVIMGRKTWASIGRPLPGRLNIVLTRAGGVPELPGQVVTAPDLATARDVAERWLDTRPEPPSPREVFVIGGAQVYAQAIADADRLVLTEIDAAFDGDVHFPDFQALDPGWTEVAREAHASSPPNDFDFAFVTYERAGRTAAGPAPSPALQPPTAP